MITMDQIQAKIREIAAESPDYIYCSPDYVSQSCYNVAPDPETDQLVGSCIVGKALVALGVPPEWFVKNHTENDSFSLVVQRMECLAAQYNFSRGPVPDYFVVYPRDEHNYQVYQWINAVQGQQDLKSLSWGAIMEWMDKK